MFPITKYFKNPGLILWSVTTHFLNWLPDKQYVRLLYFATFQKSLNLNSPMTFNEKLQWLKLFDHNPLYTIMVDKYLVKEHVSNIIGEEHVIPTLGVWKTAEEIDFKDLPEKFVLKTNHNSGGVFIVRSKATIDMQSVIGLLKKKLKGSGYTHAREWPYKNVERRIFAEKYVEDKFGENLVVYKFFCFGGEPKIVQVIQDDKTVNETIDYFDVDWNLLEMRTHCPNSKMHLPRPEKLDEMLSICEKLSAGFPFIRVDLYLANNTVYFSEYTFYSDAGFMKYEPSKWDLIMGEWIELPIQLTSQH